MIRSGVDIIGNIRFYTSCCFFLFVETKPDFKRMQTEFACQFDQKY